MMIIGCDFYPSWQQVSWLDTETGETGERKLVQASGDAERFYRQLMAGRLTAWATRLSECRSRWVET
jgi:transposase